MSRFYSGTLALLVIIGATLHFEDVAASDTRYLVFQIFTAGAGFTTESDVQAIRKLPDMGQIEVDVRDIAERIGSKGDNRNKLGFAIGPLALDYTDQQLRDLIRASFAIAARNDVAVVFHIDDSKFWMNRQDLWRDKHNVEWLDWDARANTGQFLNWGEKWKLAPQMCFNSPQIVGEVKRIATEVIGNELKRGLDELDRQSKGYLFGGVIVGWETALGRDYDSGRSLGYCALTNLGYSRLRPPNDRDAELETVVTDWIELWSGNISAAGIPVAKIFSHIAFSSREQYADESENVRKARTYSDYVSWSPVKVAFGATHNPGFTAYSEASIQAEIYAELANHGNPPWASAEGANVVIHHGPMHRASESMESYLAMRFNHGAAITNVFGWNIGTSSNPFRASTESAEALAAYRKFLAGTALAEPDPTSLRSATNPLAARMHALPDKLRSYQASGHDMRKVMLLVGEMEAQLNQGNLPAAEAKLNEIEAIAQSSGSEPQAVAGSADAVDVSRRSLQKRMHDLPARIHAYKDNGGEVRPVMRLVERLEGYIGDGDLTSAQKTLDEIAAIIE